MRPPCASVMKRTVPDEISTAFDPGSHLVRIRDSRVIAFEPRKVYAILDGELDMGVVQLHRACHVTLAKIVAVLSHRALRGRSVRLMIRLKIFVVGIT